MAIRSTPGALGSQPAPLYISLVSNDILQNSRPSALACAMILPGASAPSLRRLAPFLFRDGTLMASERQRAANGRNGRKGGSKTDAGKQRSRGNSLKHGLSASTLVVLPQEDHHEYEAILHGFRESYQPYDTAEEAL